MATREASLKVTLKPGAFQAGLRRMTSDVQAAGRRMGTALKAPIQSGLNAAKKSVAGLTSSMKGMVKTAATLGGTLATGLLVKDAIQLNSTFRNIAFNVNKISERTVRWEEIQQLVNAAALESGQKASDMAAAFDAVFQATGDLDFATKSIKAIGEASTASGLDTLVWARNAELLRRKYGIMGDEIEEGLARIIEKTGVGGVKAEDLTARFGILATNAAEAGLKGKEGLSTLLGLTITLDNALGEKLEPAFNRFFEVLRDGSVEMERIGKAGRIKFEPGEDFTEKLRKILGTSEAIAEAEKTFTGSSRIVFDVLAKPFKDTFDEVIKAGGKKQEATVKALEAFDAAMRANAGSSTTFAKVQEEAARRLAKDPTTQLRAAISKMQIAFSQPEMIKAITRLTRSLPPLAAGMASLVAFIAEKPLQAALLALSARILLAAAGGAVRTGLGVAAGAAGKGLAAVGTGALAAKGVVGGGVVAGGAVAGAGALAAGGAGFFGTRALLEVSGADKLLERVGEALAGDIDRATTRGLGGPAAAKPALPAVAALEEQRAATAKSTEGLAMTGQEADKASKSLERVAAASEKVATSLGGVVGVPGIPTGGPRGPGTAPDPMPGAAPTGG